MATGYRHDYQMSSNGLFPLANIGGKCSDGVHSLKKKSLISLMFYEKIKFGENYSPVLFLLSENWHLLA